MDWSFGLATLLRDRFVSINGGDDHGTLTTRPLNLSGARLHIDADISKNGEIMVAMLDRDGEPIAGLDNSDCKPVKGNHINMPVS